MIWDDFASMADFRDRVREAIEEAVTRRVRRLTLVDPDFEAWPLDEPALLEALTHFAQLPNRQLVLIGRHFESVRRRQPRFVAWRRTFAHAVQALAAEEGVDVPTLLLADREFALRVLEHVHWRGRAVTDRLELHRLAEGTDALAQRCEPTFAATTLGL
jgi:hypothetical protein